MRPVTSPLYLVELQFTTPVYLSSGEQYTWDGKVWKSAPIEIGSINTSPSGDQSTSMRLANHDRVYGALMMQHRLERVPVRIWLVDVEDTQYPPELMIAGVLDGAQIGDSVQASVIAHTVEYGGSPRIICAPPLMNHLPKPGTELSWGTVKYVINSR